MRRTPRVSPRRIHRPEAASTAAIGRAGTLTLHYVREGTRTVFGKTNSQTPWHLFPPIYLDDSGAAYTLLLNPSGGLVAGDHLTIDMRLEEAAHVLISTPSANRVYRSLRDESVQEIRIRLASGSRLEWFPEQTIPFAGSRFRQSIDVMLAPESVLVLWDALASGRIASGERWAFNRLCNEIRITAASGRRLIERYDLAPGSSDADIGLAHEWDYVASLFVAGDAVADSLWHRLEAEIAPILDARPDRLLGGVSRPELPGLAVKLLARAAPDLGAACDALWSAVRRTLWGLPPAVLRKY